MVALEEPLLVGGQPEGFASRMKLGDPREQVVVESDLRLVLGELWRVVAGDRFERVVGLARIRD